MHMIREEHGNLLRADTEALVNTVNTVGVMGKGIALQFKRAFPENYKAYKKACDAGQVELGRMFVWDAGAFAADGPRYVINFPTKKHWKSKSRLDDIAAGLDDLVAVVGKLGIKSIAVPPLGCGHGGLQWRDVHPMILEAFEDLQDVEVQVFPPEGTPAAAEQVNRTERPRMTPGRAALIGMMDRYLPFTVEVTPVDIQKLMYFMQEAGEPLRLNYVKGRYGPYADNLRHVLSSMEGHYIRGMGDNTAKALDVVPFEILDGAREAASEVLKDRPDTRSRMSRVGRLIEGFESTYGLELLATTHWAATRDDSGDEAPTERSSDQVVQSVERWNRRKRQLFVERHIRLALETLRASGWFVPPDDPQLSLGH